jgi:hypothetical protein
MFKIDFYLINVEKGFDTLFFYFTSNVAFEVVFLWNILNKGLIREIAFRVIFKVIFNLFYVLHLVVVVNMQKLEALVNL